MSGWIGKVSGTFNRRSKKAGLPPGTLVHIGEKKLPEAQITVLHYTETDIEERTLKSVEECRPYREKRAVTWLDVDGVHDIQIIEALGEQFGLHPLLLEDIANTTQRPKLDDYDDHILVVTKMLRYSEDQEEVTTEQISLVLGSNYVISFQEAAGDVFDNVRERIRAGKGRIRRMGADYLAYALLDAVVDGYFGILDAMGETLDSLEEELVDEPRRESLEDIHNLRRQIVSLRRSLWPLRETLSRMGRRESHLIAEATTLYIRDVYDHTVQAIDTVEVQRDVVAAMLELYLSSISNRMNEVMKVLTIIATVFIPVTFVASIYGMNFAFMPELRHPLGYPITLLGMLIVSIVMLVYFWRRGWV
jgi:magnesium transporter